MKKTLFFLFALALGASLFVQNADAVNVNVTNPTFTTPNLSSSYSSLANAITALSGITAISGPVTLTCDAEGTETAPAGGYVINFTAATTASNYVIIDGNASIITASSSLTAGNLNDAIFKIIGSDYVTLQGFTMIENPANTTIDAATNNMTEWGVALLYASLTNGAQYNTIQNNNISLNRTYSNTFGIYSNTRHSATDVTTTAEVTAFSGSNSYNKVYGNTISNVNFGIVFIGAGTTIAAIDNGNDIGGTSVGTGNTITNWGGGPAATAYVSLTGNDYGIFDNQQINDNISYNSITSGSGLTTSTVTLGGILKNYSVASPSGTITTTINNNTITLSDAPTTGGVVGISNGGLTALSTATMSINNNSVLNCAITGAGATTASMTAITNSSVPGALNMNNNIISGNSTTATTGSFTGIANAGAIITTCNINNNQIGNGSGGAISLSATVSGQVIGIFNSAGAATCNLNINSNNFQGFTYATPSSGVFCCIYTAPTVATETINTNNFNNLTINTSATWTNGVLIGASNNTPGVTISGNYITTQLTNSNSTGTSNFRLIANATGTATSGSTTISGNNLSNVTFKATAGSSAAIYWIDGSGATCTHNITVNGNTISNISNTGTIAAQTGNLYGIYASLGNINSISNNNVNLLTAAGGTAMGILTGANSTNPAGIFTVNNNIIHDIKSTSIYGTAVGSATGIQLQAAAASTNCYKNKIYDISCVVASGTGGQVAGIVTVQGTATHVANIYNNYIGRLYSATPTYVNTVRGILNANAVANTTNIYYNTVYLDGNNSTASYCFYSQSNIPNTNLRNNIFVNKIVATSTWEQMVYFFFGTLPATYLTTSNNNLLYCGTPGPLNLIYADGSATALTNKQQTLAAFQTYVAPRESLSQTENVPFLNTTTGSGNDFLHINPAVPTYVESGAVNIATYTDDYDGDVRQGNPGYGGTGTAPDIGADEFNGTPKVNCTGTPAASTINGVAAVCSGAGTTLTLSTNYTDIGITYQWGWSTTSGGPYTNAGTQATQATGNLTVTTYYVCTITCSFSGLSYITAEKAVAVNPIPKATASNNTPICEGSSINLTGVSDIGTTFNWTGPNGFTSTSQNPSITSATIAAYGTYIFTATANGCTSLESATVAIVNAAPGALTITPAAPIIVPGAIQQLTASGGVVNSILLLEDFNGTVPGWLVYNNSTGGTPANAAWMLYLSAPSFHSNDNTNFILSNSDAQGSGGITSTQLVTPALNTTGYASLSLSFYHYFLFSASPDVAKVEVSTDGGTTWVSPALISYTTTQGTAVSWAHATLDLTAYINQTNLKIRFNYYASWGYYWGIDNVSITGTQSAPITWSPTTALYVDADASVPYTGTALATVWSKPLVTTTYTATATSSTNCTSSANVTVTLCTTPTVVINDPAPRCTPNTVDLTDPAITAGSTPGLTFTYWTDASATIQYQTPTTAGAGTYYIKGTILGGCFDIQPVTVVINPLPVPTITGPTPVCAGTSGVLYSTEIGMLYYYWSISSGGIITSGGASSSTYQITVTWNTAGPQFLTVNYTDGNGCRAADATVKGVTVNPLPGDAGTISGPSTVTQGQTGVLFSVAPIADATGYTWSLPAGATITSGANTNSITVSFSASAVSGIITVTGTNTCGNGTVSLDFNLTVTTGVPVDLEVDGTVTGTKCYNATNRITVAETAPFTVQAGGHAEMIAGVAIDYKPGTTVHSEGYMWGHIAPNGPWCVPITAPSIVTVPMGIEEVQGQSFFKVYPNPTTGSFTLELSEVPGTSIVKVEIYGMRGEKILNDQFTGEKKHEFSLESNPTGIYFIRVFCGDNLGSQKIIKQ
jgi:hypothetical protein